MSIKNALFKIFNGSAWDEYHFKTNSGQVVHTPENGEQTTVEEELNDLNRKLDGIGLRYQTVTLSYANATTLRGYTSFATPVLCAVANIEDQAGTPTTQVNNIVTDIGYGGTAGRVEVYANGSNFVSGHVLKVNVIAIVQN